MKPLLNNLPMNFLKNIFLNLVIVLFSFVLGFYLEDIDILLELKSFKSPFFFVIGLIGLLLALFLRFWATFVFYKNRLHILRMQAQQKLVILGPYKFTRNPLYVGLILIFFGTVLLLGSWIGLLVAILHFFGWNYWVANFEEKNLQKAFKANYLQYKQKVPRWLTQRPKQILGILFVTFLIFFFIYGVTNKICPTKQAAVNENQVTIDGQKIYYNTAGDQNNPPLVFLPGWGSRPDDVCGKGVKKVTADFSKHFFVYSMEPPGLGRSQPPDEIWSAEDYAKFLDSFIQKLQIEKPIIMGQSFGGGIATAYANLYPQNLPYLILVDASQANRPENFYYQLRFYWNPFFKFMINNNFVPLSFKRTVINLYIGVPENFIIRSNVKKIAVMSDIEKNYKVKVDYKTLLMPVLLVWGENDTFVTPLKRAIEIDQEIPNSKLVIIDGGHLALYTNTEEVIKAVLENLPEKLKAQP